MAIYLGISHFTPLIYLLSLFLIFIGGIWVCEAAGEIFQELDSSYIVVDEICGYLIAMFLLPKSLFFITLSFIIFRLLDSLKLYPINMIQRMKNSFGVMLDDLVCGILTNIILQMVKWIYV